MEETVRLLGAWQRAIRHQDLARRTEPQRWNEAVSFQPAKTQRGSPSTSAGPQVLDLPHEG